MGDEEEKTKVIRQIGGNSDHLQILLIEIRNIVEYKHSTIICLKFTSNIHEGYV